MDNHERARRANAALTTAQRVAAAKLGAAALHHPITLARRIVRAWPGLPAEDRDAVLRELSAAIDALGAGTMGNPSECGGGCAAE